MKITVFYVGSSLLAPLKNAGREINKQYRLGLTVAAYNCTLPVPDAEWPAVERDIVDAEIVLIIHVTDNDNAARIAAALDGCRSRHRAVLAINCMRDLMVRTRLGKLNGMKLFNLWREKERSAIYRAVRDAGSWMGSYARARNRESKGTGGHKHSQLLKQMPSLLRLTPAVGVLRDVKHYLTAFCYLLQPTPGNIRSLLLYTIRHYIPEQAGGIHRIDAPENRPSTGIYHPDAASLFSSFEEYCAWYEARPSDAGGHPRMDTSRAIGLLLTRPQIVSGACRHYDYLIRLLESDGLPVVPVLSTFMDNREACQEFLVDAQTNSPRVAQLVSLTGFSFVGGPAMNDSEAAVEYLKVLNRPFRSIVSLEMQRIEQWEESVIGLNPVQTTMQVAIPEIDGATEPFVFGGLAAGKDEPEALEERCERIVRRLVRWDRLRLAPRSELRLAFIVYCFPPDKGNLGTAAELDVFPSIWNVLRRLQDDGYRVDVPETPDALRGLLLGANSGIVPAGEHLAAVAYRMPVEEYYHSCPYVREIEEEWGPAPGRINAHGRDLLIHGVQLKNVFLGVQPTFGYEGDPMRMMMAKNGTPHHGFMAFYLYLEDIFRADALIHVGTHGALEFMPGKQAGLSDRCWPDRLIWEFPNIYIYSVNNPSEGTIAKRRSYAELVSYLTPPIENAGLYRDLAALKELLFNYRQVQDEAQKEELFVSIEEKARYLNLELTVS